MNDYGVVIQLNSIRFERLLPGPIERVWSYLIDSEKRGEWFCSGPMEARVGGNIELVFNHRKLSKHDHPPPRNMRDTAARCA